MSYFTFLRFNNSRSHDGFQEDGNGYLVAANDKYADQRKVFNDLGAGVLKNAFEGNCNQTNLVICQYLSFSTVYF